MLYVHYRKTRILSRETPRWITWCPTTCLHYQPGNYHLRQKNNYFIFYQTIIFTNHGNLISKEWNHQPYHTFKCGVKLLHMKKFAPRTISAVSATNIMFGLTAEWGVFVWLLFLNIPPKPMEIREIKVTKTKTYQQIFQYGA